MTSALSWISLLSPRSCAHRARGRGGARGEGTRADEGSQYTSTYRQQVHLQAKLAAGVANSGRWPLQVGSLR